MDPFMCTSVSLGTKSSSRKGPLEDSGISQSLWAGQSLSTSFLLPKNSPICHDAKISVSDTISLVFRTLFLFFINKEHLLCKHGL